MSTPSNFHSVNPLRWEDAVNAWNQTSPLRKNITFASKTDENKTSSPILHSFNSLRWQEAVNAWNQASSDPQQNLKIVNAHPALDDALIQQIVNLFEQLVG